MARADGAIAVNESNQLKLDVVGRVYSVLVFPIGYVLPSVFAGRSDTTSVGMIVAVMLMAANSLFIGSMVAWICRWFVGDCNTQRLRWFQFRLRTLLVAILLLSLPLSWFGWRLEEARRQRKAVEAIRQMGGLGNATECV